MATAIKAIPTLKGREARSFLRRADAVERIAFSTSDNRKSHPYCRMAKSILGRAGKRK